MSSTIENPSDEQTKWSYQGPIFDADTHLFETPDAFSKYLPADMRKDYSIAFRVADDGQYALHVGKQKVDITADHYADGKVPAPGKLHEWLRAIKEGRLEIDLRVEMTPDMLNPADRVKTLDRWGVQSSIVYIGHMLAALTNIEVVEPTYKLI